MTPADELAAMCKLLTDLRASRAQDAELPEFPNKAAMMAQYDATIAEAELTLTCLQRDALVKLPSPAGVQ